MIAGACDPRGSGAVRSSWSRIGGGISPRASLEVTPGAAVALWDGAPGGALGAGFAAIGSPNGIQGDPARWSLADASRVSGDFSLIVPRADGLLLARGRFGGRPLYYARGPDRSVLACSQLAPLSGVECGKTGCTDRASICKSGVCEGAKPKDCNKDVSVCRVGVCDPSNGACALSDVPNGTPCATDDKCMVDTACMHGECKGQKKSCTPSGPCKVAACNPATGACEEQDAPAGQCAGPGPGPGPGNVDAGAPGSDSPPSSEAGCSVGVSGGGGGGVALAALAGLAGVFVRRRRARR